MFEHNWRTTITYRSALQQQCSRVFFSSGAALRRAQRRASITTGAHKLALIVAIIDALCPVAATGRRKKERDAARANHNESDAHLQCSVATGDAQIDALTRREGGRAQREHCMAAALFGSPVRGSRFGRA